MFNLISDLHIHTVASQHAYSTISDVVSAAREKNLGIIGITDHGPAMLDGPKEYYFLNMRLIPRDWDGITVLRGVELNIIDEYGMVDLKSHFINHLDYAIASCHLGTIPFSYSKDQYTNAYLLSLDHPKVKILGHVDNPAVPFDMEAVLEKAKKKKVLIEVNNSSYRTDIRPGSRDTGIKMLELAKKMEVPVIVNSDAHISFDVGVFDEAIEVLSKVDFPENLIVNTSTERLKEYFCV